jgi:hypothetical protein
MNWTEYRLTEWGRWAKGGMPGLPTASNWEIVQQGHGFESHVMPTHIEEVDKVVCIAPQPEKSVLIHFYAKTGAFNEKAKMLGMNRWRFKRILDRARSFVDNHL